MPRLGRRPGRPDSGYGYLTPATTRASIMGSLQSAGWITSVGFRGGRSGSATAYAKAVIYNVSGSTITSLVHQSRTFAVSTYMNDNAGGTDYIAPVTNVPYTAGRNLALGIFCDTGDMTFGQDNSGHLMHTANGRPAPDPFGADDVRPQGKMSVWAEVVTNRAPNTPGIVAPRSGSVVSTATVDIKVRHSDRDEVYGDAMSAYNIEVWNASNTSRIKYSGVKTATPAEIASGVAVWSPTLTPGQQYTVRARTYDRHGVGSPVQVWSFQINAGGAWTDTVPAAVDVAGSLDDGTLVINTVRPRVTTTWTHSSGSATDNITLRIVNDATGAVYREDTFETTQANGQTVTLSYRAGWADMARGATRYRYEVSSVDALGGRSPWSSSPPFLINAAPNVPVFRQPYDIAVTVPPVLSCEATDATDPEETLLPEFAIRAQGDTGDGTTVPASRLFRRNDRWHAQLTSAEMPSLGVYEWRVRASDPWGQVGAWSSWLSLTLTTPPDVTILTPTGTVTTGTPTVSWTVDRAQQARRVEIRRFGTQVVLWDSGTATTASTSVAIPGATLPNNTDYQGALHLTTTDGLTITVPFAFRVEYPQPDPLTGVTLTKVRSSVFDYADGHEQLPNVELAWNRVSEATVPNEDWLGYVVYRLGDDDPRMWEIANRDQLTFTDTTPAGGVNYTWYVGYRRRINSGLDEIESILTALTASVEIRHTVITSASPDDPAVTLMYWEDRAVGLQTRTAVVETMDDEAPTIFQGPQAYDTVDGTFTVLDDRGGHYTAREIVDAARQLAKQPRDPDGMLAPRALHYRDGKGRSFPLAITEAPQETDHHRHDRATFTLRGVEQQVERGPVIVATETAVTP